MVVVDDLGSCILDLMRLMVQDFILEVACSTALDAL